MDINVAFHDNRNNQDVWFWKTQTGYTMFVLDPPDYDEDGEHQDPIIWDFKYENGVWTFKNTGILHPDYGGGSECLLISSGDQLPPAEGWDEDTPPELVDYLHRVHNIIDAN